jgi:hypothetical protein
VNTTDGDGFASESIDIEGFGPGGQITGLTNLNGQMYAVSDRGGLWQVNTFGGGGFGGTATDLGTYVRTSAADFLDAGNGQPIQFAGLSFGPARADGGRYSQMLFAATSGGGGFGGGTGSTLYAFDVAGNLQPIFANGQRALPLELNGTPLTAVTGIAFSTLDYNLWQTTGQRGGTAHPGHGIPDTFDDRGRVTGGTSFYFGNTVNGGGNNSSNGPGGGNYGVLRRDYDFPGGAHGTLESNPFSLEGYTAADLPVMYFTYYLQTEDGLYTGTNGQPMRDSFRVYVVAEDGETTLVATNNLAFGLTVDEFDIGEDHLRFPAGVASELPGQGFTLECEHASNQLEPCVQRLFEQADGVDQWRQARVPLARFAGEKNLRLRFDFSSAGSMNLGDIRTTGEEMRSIPGADIRDAQIITVQNGETFAVANLEFDSGYTLVAPTGANLDDGDQFTLDDGRINLDIPLNVFGPAGISDGNTFSIDAGFGLQTFEFDFNPNPGLFNPAFTRIAVPPGSTASDVAIAVRNAINSKFGPNSGVAAVANGNRVTLNPPPSVVVDTTGTPNIVVTRAVLFEFDGNNLVARNMVIPPGSQFSDGNVFRVQPNGGVATTFELDSGYQLQLSQPLQIIVPTLGVADKQWFRVSNATRSVEIEFDSDQFTTPGRQSVNLNDITLTIPIAGGNTLAGGVADGETFTINNGATGGLRRFEFDSNGTFNAANVVIRFSDGTVQAPTSRLELAQRVVDAIRRAGLGLTPVTAATPATAIGVVRLGADQHVVSATSAPSLIVGTASQTQDALARQIVERIANANLGLNVSYLGAGVIDLGANASHSIDLSNSALSSTGQAAGIENGDTFTIANGAVGPVLFEFDSDNIVFPGSRVINIRENLAIQVSPNGTSPGGVRDSTTAGSPQTFTITNGATTRTFEFDNTGVVTGGNTLINIKDHFLLMLSELGAAIGGVVDGESFRIDNGGNSFVFEFDNEGTRSSPTNIPIFIRDHINIEIPFDVFGPTGIDDMDTFSIDNGSGPVIFEFDFDPDPGATTPPNIRIPIRPGDAASDVAISVRDVINAQFGSGSGVTAIASGDTVQLTNPTPAVVVDTTGTPNLVQTTTPITGPELVNLTIAAINGNAGVGLTAVARNFGQILLQSPSANHNVNVSSAPSVKLSTVPLTQSEVSAAIRTAIAGAGLGLTPIDGGAGQVVLSGTTANHTLTTSALGIAARSRAKSLNEISNAIVTQINTAGLSLNSINLTNGRIHVGGDTNHVLNATSTPTIAVSGTPGVQAPNVRIPFVPVDTVATMVNRVTNAINTVAPGTATADTGRVILNGGAQFDPGTSPITPEGLVRVPFTSNSSAAQVGGSIASAVASAGFQTASSANFIVEPNDSPANAFPSGLNSTGLFRAAGVIGDSAGGFFDFDWVQVQLAAGDRVQADVDAAENGSTLNSTLFLLDSSFNTIGFSDNTAAPGEALTTDSYFDVTVAAAGTYYVIVGSNTFPANGTYSLQISVNSGTNAAVTGGAGGQRVNVPGVLTANAPNLPAFFIEGAPGVAPGNTPILVNEAMGEAEIAQAVAQVMAQSLAGYTAAIVTSGGSQIADGDTFIVRDGPTEVTFEFDSGFLVQIPQTLTLNLPASVGAFGAIVNDGDRFRISDGVNTSFFEYSTDAVFTSGSIPIRFNFGDSQQDIAGFTVAAINSAGLGLTPSHIGGGQILLGSQANHSAAVIRGQFTITGRPGGIVNDEQFVMNDGQGGPNVTFEFDSDLVASPNRLIDITDVAITIPLAGGGPGGVADGHTFVVNDGTQTITFEMQANNPPNNPFTDADGNGVPDNVLIRFNDGSAGLTSTQEDLANFIAGAIATAFVELPASNAGNGSVRLNGVNGRSATVTFPIGNALGTAQLPASHLQIAARLAQQVASAGISLTPTNFGGGIVHLGGTTHTLDASLAPDLIQLGGTPGVTPGNVSISYVPWEFESAVTIAQKIEAAIDAQTFGVDATRVGRRVQVNGPLVTVDASGTPSFTVDTPLTATKINNNLIHVLDATILSQSPGPHNGRLLGVEDTLAGDEFGAFFSSGPNVGSRAPKQFGFPGALRAMNNTAEGVYVDDVIIGFAGRGEMILNATTDTSFADNMEFLDARLPFIHDQTLVGEYQLEIRRGEDYAVWPIGSFNSPDALILRDTVNMNDRAAEAVGLRARAGEEISDGERFTISDGINSRTFEFDDLTLEASKPIGVVPGNVAIPYRPSDTAELMAERIRDAINSERAKGSFDVAAALFDGIVQGVTGTGDLVNLSGNARIIASEGVNGQISGGNTVGSDQVFRFDNTSQTGEAIRSITVTLPAGLNFNTVLRGGTTGTNINSKSNQVGATFRKVAPDEIIVDFSRFQPNQKFVFGFDIFGGFFGNAHGRELFGTTATIEFDSGRIVQDVFTLIPQNGNIAAVLGDDRTLSLVQDSYGDRNTVRDQGQIVVHSNVIRSALQFGISADSGQRLRTDLATLAGAAAHPGPVLNHVNLNNEGLAPGAVISNNVITQSGTGGIRFSGDTNAAMQGAVPFGRIVNNTVYGGGITGDVGIQVDQSASPTLINNIIADFDTAITVDNTSLTTVIGATLFQNNGVNGNIGGSVFGPTTGPGSFPIALGPNDPLFVNPATGNFYPQALSPAIDSSLDSLQDRDDYANRVREPLGIAESPILAPDRDVLGQLRVDDPTVSTPAAQGANVFKDRGAVDRADSIGPTAELLNPRDNDANGIDQDRNESFVNLASGVLSNFEILLRDINGTGPEPSSITTGTFTLSENGRTLVEGVDFVVGFNPTNNTVRFTPLSGIWRPASVYDITINNRDRLVINVPGATNVVDGSQFTIQDSRGTTKQFEFDSGFVLNVPQTLTLVVPAAGGAVGGIQDGETFDVSDGVVTRRFEFDNDGVFNQRHCRHDCDQAGECRLGSRSEKRWRWRGAPGKPQQTLGRCCQFERNGLR